MKIQSNINELVKSKGYRKGWVAEKVGVSATQFSMWCKNVDGNVKSGPSLENIVMLMIVLDCGFNDLFKWSD